MNQIGFKAVRVYDCSPELAKFHMIKPGSSPEKIDKYCKFEDHGDSVEISVNTEPAIKSLENNEHKQVILEDLKKKLIRFEAGVYVTFRKLDFICKFTGENAEAARELVYKTSQTYH